MGQLDLIQTSDFCFELLGSDAISWLQGQVSNDIQSIKVGQSIHACLCKATGQIEDVITIYRDTSRISLICQMRDPILKRIANFRIMENVDIRLLYEGVIHFKSDLSCDSIEHHRYGVRGYDLAWNGEGNEPVRPSRPETEEDRADALIAGMPRMGQDINEKTLAAELGQEFLDRTVSFTKGCYVGQEINHRIYARGHVNQQWVRMMSANRIEAGTPVERNGEKVGEVRACLKSRDHDYVCSVFVKGSEMPFSLTAGGKSLTIIPSIG